MINVHWHSAFIKTACFINKKNCLLFCYIVILRNISILQFFVQRICICICQNGFQNFFIVCTDSQNVLVWHIPRSDIRLMLRFPSNSSRAFFWVRNTLFKFHFNCHCFKVYCICFRQEFPSWKCLCTSGCSWKSFLIFSRYQDLYRK